MGGISGQQETPCGAVSASAVCLGLRHRCPLSDKGKAGQSRALIRHNANRLVREFKKAFGNITCAKLVGIDFSEPGAYQAFHESGIGSGCASSWGSLSVVSNHNRQTLFQPGEALGR